MSADTGNFKRDMAGAEGSLKKFGATSTTVERQSGRATQGIGRLGGQFGTLLGQMTGVNPTLVRIGTTLSTFATSAGPIAIAVAGLAALAFAWQRITRASREAGQEMQSALERLKAIQLRESQGVFGQTGADVGSGMKLAGKLSRDIRREEGLLGREGATFMETELRKRNIARLKVQYAEAIAAVRAGERAVRRAVEDANSTAIKPATTRIRETMAADMVGINLSWAQILRAREADRARGRAEAEAIGGPLAAGAQKELGDAARLGGYGTASSPLLRTLDESVRAQSGFVEATETLGDKMRDALGSVSHTLLQGLQNVAMAMLPGGTGTGSRIGASLGGTLLGAIGLGGGPFGAALGGVVGSLAGSLLGGLFDKPKKAGDRLADTLERVNQQFRNAPSGYLFRSQELRSDSVGTPPDPTFRPPGDPSRGGIYIGEVKVLANNPAQFISELGRMAQQQAARGGTSRLSLAVTG